MRRPINHNYVADICNNTGIASPRPVTADGVERKRKREAIEKLAEQRRMRHELGDVWEQIP